MVYDTRETVKSLATAILFAEHLAEGYLAPAFEARAKCQIDLLVFTVMSEVG